MQQTILLLEFDDSLTGNVAEVRRLKESRLCRRQECAQYGASESVDYRLHKMVSKRSLPPLVCNTDLRGVFLASVSFVDKLACDGWSKQELFHFGRALVRGDVAVDSHVAVRPRYNLLWMKRSGLGQTPALRQCSRCGQQLFPTLELTGESVAVFQGELASLPPVFSVGNFTLGVTPRAWAAVDWTSVKTLQVTEMPVVGANELSMERVAPDEDTPKTKRRPLP